MKSVKQVIVMRSDLKNKEGEKVRTGKLIAQACHSSIAFLTQIVMGGKRLSEVQKLWMNESFRKICLKVNSEEELWDIRDLAEDAGIAVHLIRDAGLTEFNEPTYTCLALGPDYDEKIDKITGHLKLL